MNSDNGASISNAVIETIFHNGIDSIEELHWNNPIPDKVVLVDNERIK